MGRFKAVKKKYKCMLPDIGEKNGRYLIYRRKGKVWNQ